MEPVVRAIGIWGHPDLRSWEPEDPEAFAELVMLDIGPRDQRSADGFTLRVATPAGLARLEDQDGILATRPLLVMRRYDPDALRRWIVRTVSSCRADTWLGCVEKLRRHFDWEYDGYRD